MAEQKDPAMAELMELLETEPANAHLTFQPRLNSLQFSFPRANARKRLA